MVNNSAARGIGLEQLQLAAALVHALPEARHAVPEERVLHIESVDVRGGLEPMGAGL